ncbi:MAG: S9 family peptidase [Bacteroidetes bacterium]|nr:S9 family peptidase [Bacteroidota bacterium]
MKKQKIQILLAGIFVFLIFTAKASISNEGLTPEQLFELKTVLEVYPSPDNNYIAYTLLVPRPFTHNSGSDYRELHVYDVRKKISMPFITGNKSIFSIGWTPKGDAVTFRANFSDQPGIQVYGISLSGGESYPITQHTASVNSYEFIDDNTLAIVSISPDNPLRQELRKRGWDIEVYEEEYRQLNLYRYDLNTHQVVQLTKDVTVFDFTLSPDKKWAAAAIAPRNLVDDSYMFKDIYIVNMLTGESKLLVDVPGKLENLSWSPDGKKLAFRSSSKLEDSVAGSLFVVDVPNNKPFEQLRNYVKAMELSVIDIGWKDNNTLLYAAEEGVDIVLSEQRLDKPTREIIISPEKVCFNRFNFKNGIVTFSGNTSQHPGELFSYNFKRKTLEKHTNHNPQLSDIKFGKQKKHVYNARDGKDIQGVLVYPLNYTEGKKYPLIVYIHGGPEAAVKNGWSTGYSMWGQIASARDYFVFMPNYRASSGRGVEFTMAGYGDLAGVEFDDVLDGIDDLINKGMVDPKRVGMGGGSYGGYFSAWAATKHTERFAAAVVFVGISNQISKRNNTDIPWEDYYVHWGYWTHKKFEDVYSRSPIKYAHQSKTPTLVLHGTEDSRVHPAQGLELYRTLKLHGQAPVRLIWYNGEGHGNRKNVHRLDYLIRTMEWFDYYLRLDMPKDQMPEKYPDFGYW